MDSAKDKLQAAMDAWVDHIFEEKRKESEAAKAELDDVHEWLSEKKSQLAELKVKFGEK